MLKSIRLMSVCRTVVMMVAPPGDPTASQGAPLRSTIVGLMLDRGRLPGAARIRVIGLRRRRCEVEVGHLVIQQEPVSRDGDAAARNLFSLPAAPVIPMSSSMRTVRDLGR